MKKNVVPEEWSCLHTIIRKMAENLLRVIGVDPVDGSYCVHRVCISDVCRNIVNCMVVGGSYLFI